MIFVDNWREVHDRVQKALKGETIWEFIVSEGGEELRWVISSNKMRTVYFLYKNDGHTLSRIASAKTPDILHRRYDL